MKPDLQPFLDQLTSRSLLSDAEQEAVLGLPTRVMHVGAHRDVVRWGEIVEHATIVSEGIVGRFGQNVDGGRQIITLHVAGDAPGLHLVVLPNDACPLQALSPTTVLRVPHSALRALAARYPVVAEAFWRQCCVDAAITARWVVNLGRRDAKVRISHLLCEMAVRSHANTDRHGVTFSFPLTHTHLADATGMTPVHVCRTIRALREEGLAILSDRKAEIPDWNRLVKYAEFEPSYLQAPFRQREIGMMQN